MHSISGRPSRRVGSSILDARNQKERTYTICYELTRTATKWSSAGAYGTLERNRSRFVEVPTSHKLAQAINRKMKETRRARTERIHWPGLAFARINLESAEVRPVAFAVEHHS